MADARSTKPADPAPRARKRPPSLSEATKSASKAYLRGTGDLPPEPVRPRFRPTEVPGVYLNADGLKVDESGVLLTLRPLQVAEAARDEEILGEPVTTPAQLLKRVALDPSLALHIRMTAAVAAAPYFDRKMPTALEGGPEGSPPIRTEHSVTLKNLNALGPEERKAALLMLEKLGIL